MLKRIDRKSRPRVREQERAIQSMWAPTKDLELFSSSLFLLDRVNQTCFLLFDFYVFFDTVSNSSSSFVETHDGMSSGSRSRPISSPTMAPYELSRSSIHYQVRHGDNLVMRPTEKLGINLNLELAFFQEGDTQVLWTNDNLNRLRCLHPRRLLQEMILPLNSTKVVLNHGSWQDI